MQPIIFIGLSLMIGTAACRPSQDKPGADEKFPHTVSTEILSDDTDAATVMVRVNDKEIAAAVSEDSGLKNFDAGDVSLEPDEIENLRTFANQYQVEHLSAEGQASLGQKATFLLLDYLSSAPANVQLQSKTYDALALANNGVTCIKKGTSVKAEWNTRTQGYVSEWITTGANWPNGYGCMGRCGADCGWGAPSAWTKDCMDHDACSYRNNASGGGSDPNCGDEYNEAQDDWFQGVSKGCSG